MYSLIPKHPIPMKTVFRNCFLVNFAVDPEIMRRGLPPEISPDLYADKAFLSVVIADMEKMRPAFLPRALGITYNQVVYRAVVRCGGERGVHFLRSDADNRWMSIAGDLLTFFHFNHSRVTQKQADGRYYFDLESGDHADIHATFDVAYASQQMPAASKFPSLAEAQGFLVELYAAFTSDSRHISTVRIKRGEWQIGVVEDLRGVYEFMDGSTQFPSGSAQLDSVFYVSDVSYHWFTLEKRPRTAAIA
jgi:uncharacterized protein YqjF (DUF2071 family)